jgi:hypothetical protein
MSKNICKVALLIALGMFGLNAVAEQVAPPAPNAPVTGKDVVKKEDKDAKKPEDQTKKPEDQQKK